MGTMRHKRRKKLQKAWDEFQAQYGLSDTDIKLARETGVPYSKLVKLALEPQGSEETSLSQRIGEIHRSWRDNIEVRKSAIEAGLIPPKKKKTKKKAKFDPAWAKAKEVCRLNMEDIRKAKELGISPKALMKNVPNAAQVWKAPVKVWIADLYEKRFRNRSERPEAIPMQLEGENLVN